MITEQNTEREVTSTLGGQKIAMSFDESSLGHLMKVLTDLYSDPELAVLREYSTNALDAHVEAGIVRPIEVTLPSPLSPFFKVRDFGVGLTVADIENIYSKYGASTKRATNDQVGMLGLGCKSALTYADQFTLVSVKDGRRVQVAISRDEDGSGTMTVVDDCATSDPNGTEVVVPAKRLNTFERKAAEFFSYWTEGTVLVNGAEPKRLQGLWVSDTLCAVKGHQSYIVMGNVAYPATLRHGMSYGNSLVAFVGIGEVTFPPSRESLMDTKNTRATIERVEADFKTAATGAVQREIDAATTPQAAVRVMVEWAKTLPGASSRGQYTYKGSAIPSTIRPKADDVMQSVVPVRSHVMSRCSKTRDVGSDQWGSSVWFHGYDRASFTAGQKKKLVMWLDNHPTLDQQTVEYFVLGIERPDTAWLDAARVIDWKEVEAIKLPRNAPLRSGRIPGSYDVIEDGGAKAHMQANDIDQGKAVYYFNGQSYNASAYVKLLLDHHRDDEGFYVVCMPANRVEKFKRNFPDAVSAQEGVQALYTAWEKSITDDLLLALTIHDDRAQSDLRKLDAERINDPELRKAIRTAKLDIGKVLAERRTFQSVARSLNEKYANWQNPLDNYPLFDSYSMTSPQGVAHTYVYINAAYAADSQEN